LQVYEEEAALLLLYKVKNGVDEVSVEQVTIQAQHWEGGEGCVIWVDC
jgi:hypothetical protein